MKKLVLSLTAVILLPLLALQLYGRLYIPFVAQPLVEASSEDLFKLTNQRREQFGREPLALDPRLNKSASDKCEHMIANDYWEHVSPDGTEPWGFIEKSYGNYQEAGENLSEGYSRPGDVISAWMNSPGHRENLLSPDYSDVGFAICTPGAELYVVQHFAS